MISASDFFLRWFTPKKEVPLCGHATLATAAALFDNGKMCCRDNKNCLTYLRVLTEVSVEGGCF